MDFRSSTMDHLRERKRPFSQQQNLYRGTSKYQNSKAYLGFQNPSLSIQSDQVFADLFTNTSVSFQHKSKFDSNYIFAVMDGARFCTAMKDTTMRILFLLLNWYNVDVIYLVLHGYFILKVRYYGCSGLLDEIDPIRTPLKYTYKTLESG